MNTKLKEKMKSRTMWLSLTALVVFLIKEFTGVDFSGFTGEFLNLLLPVLVGLGIVNNPNDRSGF